MVKAHGCIQHCCYNTIVIWHLFDTQQLNQLLIDNKHDNSQHRKLGKTPALKKRVKKVYTDMTLFFKTNTVYDYTISKQTLWYTLRVKNCILFVKTNKDIMLTTNYYNKLSLHKNKHIIPLKISLHLSY